MQFTGVTTVYVEFSGPLCPDGSFDGRGGGRLRPVRVGGLPVAVQLEQAASLNESLLLPHPPHEGEAEEGSSDLSPPAPPSDGLQGGRQVSFHVDHQGHDTGKS